MRISDWSSDVCSSDLVPLSGSFSVGPFEIELITLTHSIPEPNAVVIRTAAGTVLHTGDWKLDPTPLVGEAYDEQRLKALADENVLAMVGDSTNAMAWGDAGSEAEDREQLLKVVSGLQNREGRSAERRVGKEWGSTCGTRRRPNTT